MQAEKKRNNTIMKTAAKLIISYLITFAIFNIGHFESTDILLGLIFVSVFAILHVGPDIFAKEYDRRVNMASGIVSAIWTISYMIYRGEELKGGMDNVLFAAFYVALTVSGIYVFIFFVIRSLTEYVINRYCDGETTVSVGDHGNDAGKSEKFDIVSFLIYSGLLFVLLLPLFLLNYPGTLTVDSFNQLLQVKGAVPYDNQHPWPHTMLIGLIFNTVADMSGDEYVGIAAYSLFQMLIMALSAAYACVSVFPDRKRDRIARVLLLLGFVLYPYNLIYSFTMWKDVLFGAAVLIFTVSLYRIWMPLKRDDSVGIRDTVLFTISGLGMCLLRHNGYYAFLAVAPILVIVEILTGLKKKRNRKRLINVIISIAIVISVTSLIHGPIEKAYKVEDDHMAHNIPIPLQQIARVVYDGCYISDEDLAMIERLNSVDYLREEYTPGGADPTMQWMMFGDEEYLLAHKGEYLNLWVRLGIRYPGEYILAYFDQTKGYYTVMAPEQTEFYGIMPNELGLETKPVMGATVRIKINEILFKIHTVLPVYAILYSMGSCLLILILGIAIILLEGKEGCFRLLTFLPVLMITGTLFVATPLVADLRYSYPLMISMPSLIGITLKKAKKPDGQKEIK